MVDDLNNKAIAAGETDSYKFARPFADARLENTDLDVIRREAKALTRDLAEHDRKLKAAVTAFRQKAQAEFQAGKPLPAVPAELHQLQALRTALMIRHMASLRAQLGPQKTSRIDGYLAQQFAPHVSLKALKHSPGNVTAEAQTQGFAVSPQ